MIQFESLGSRASSGFADTIFLEILHTVGHVIKSIGHFRVLCQNAPWIVLGTLSLLSLAITLPRKLGQKVSPKQFHSAVRHKTDQVLISPPKWPMTCSPDQGERKAPLVSLVREV